MLTNSEIADKFEEIADYLEILDDNRYRIQAYRKAARTILNCNKTIDQLVKQGLDLTMLPNIGKDLAQKILTLVDSGRLSILDELYKKVPQEVCKLLKIPGLGPKKIAVLRKKLNINSLQDLSRAIEAKKIRTLPGFGIKSEQKLANNLSFIKKSGLRISLWHATLIAKPLLEYLYHIPEIKRVVIAGSFRRQRETIGDLDILVTTSVTNLEHVKEKILNYPRIESIIAMGNTKVSFYVKTHFQVDIRIVQDRSFGAALQYFTGSKEHNVAIRNIGIKNGLLINEYGIFKDSRLLVSETEEEFYRTLGLPFIEPELRENKGEVEAAYNNKLPRLINLNDIKGDLHIHTNSSDGGNSLEEIYNRYQEKGYQYIAITDHSKSQKIAHGLTEKELLEQIEFIDRLNERLVNFRILKGCEIDILEDGSLDFDKQILKKLDIRVCSIHSNFNLSRSKQMQRIKEAMNNPYFNIFAHPTGRLLGKRQPYEVDMEELLYYGKERNCAFELNSQYERFDLNDNYCRMAKEVGVKISIATDLHNIQEIDFMNLGISQARRGWLEAKDVINTYSLKDLLKFLNKF